MISQFFEIVLPFLGLLIIPGQDMALILLTLGGNGRTSATWTAAGFSFALFVQTGIAILGLSHLATTFPLRVELAASISMLGVSFWFFFRSQKENCNEVRSPDGKISGSHFWIGFLSTVFNVKVIVFLVAIVSALKNTNLVSGASYCLLLALICFLFYQSPIRLANRPSFLAAFSRQRLYLTAGVCFLFIGVGRLLPHLI